MKARDSDRIAWVEKNHELLLKITASLRKEVTYWRAHDKDNRWTCRNEAVKYGEESDRWLKLYAEHTQYGQLMGWL